MHDVLSSQKTENEEFLVFQIFFYTLAQLYLNSMLMSAEEKQRTPKSTY